MKNFWFAIFAFIGIAAVTSIFVLACAINNVASQHGRVADVGEKGSTELKSELQATRNEVSRMTSAFESLGGEMKTTREEAKALLSMELARRIGW